MRKIKIVISMLLGFVLIGAFNACVLVAPVDYQLSTSSTPSNGGSVSPSGGTHKQGSDVTLVATPATYYKFNGWAGDISDSTERVTVKMDSNKNIVASFTKLTHSLQLNVNVPDSGTLDTKSGNYEAGNQVNITATPAMGYRFDHWGGSAAGTGNPLSVLVDTDKTITAFFTKQYTLKISSNPNNGGSTTPRNGAYDAGAKVQLTATQVFPYIFTGWTGTDNDNSSPTVVTMNTDKSVTCTFIEGTIGPWKEETFPVYRGGSFSYNLELKQFEYAEGAIMKGTSPASIQDPTGTTIKDFGGVGQANFLITALIPGRYTIIFYNNDQGALKQDYTVKYRIYRR